MARKPTHPPDARTQLRLWCQGLGARKQMLRTLTPGPNQPQNRHPSLAMAGLNSILHHAHAESGWMALDLPSKPREMGETFRRTACARFSNQAAVVALAGPHSHTIAWLFADKSVLLTQRTDTGLRLYPSIIWMRSREPGWTPSLLIGRKTDEPVLRITHVTHARQPRPSQEIQSAYAALEPGFIPPPVSMFPAIGTDVDALGGIFESFEGCAILPTGEEIPDNRWPACAPHPGAPHACLQSWAGVMESAAAWLGAAGSTWMNGVELGENLCRVEIHIQSGRLVVDFNLGSSILSCVLDWVDVGRIFPPSLAIPLQAALAARPGLSYHPPSSGAKRATTGPWVDLGAGANTPESRHAHIALFAIHGAPPQGADKAWLQILTR